VLIFLSIFYYYYYYSSNVTKYYIHVCMIGSTKELTNNPKFSTHQFKWPNTGWDHVG